jgi:hypothetical protein
MNDVTGSTSVQSKTTAFSMLFVLLRVLVWYGLGSIVGKISYELFVLRRDTLFNENLFLLEGD